MPLSPCAIRAASLYAQAAAPCAQAAAPCAQAASPRAQAAAPCAVFRWVVHHFFYAHKPWAPWARCPEYFDFLGDGGETDLYAAHGASRCQAILSEKQRCLGRPGQGVPAEATCKACAAQSTHADEESRAQLQWACRQPTACPKPWDIEWEIF